MTEEHKNKIAEILMNDYDIRPSLARSIVRRFEESAEQIIKEDEGLAIKQIETEEELKFGIPEIPEACRHCSSHPSNGGSGICDCTLGGRTITC